MKSLPAEVSPPALSRIGGLLYLVIIVIGIYVQTVVRGSVVVAGDPLATAANLRASEGVWRAGIALDLFSCACTAVLAWILYGLLRVVDRHLATLMLLLEGIAIATQVVFDLNMLVALFPLGRASYLSAFSAEQLATMAHLSARAQETGFGITLLFFGLLFPVRGYLIARSGFMPSAIGVLVAVAGIGYVVNGFTMILAPGLARGLFLLVAPLILIGEGALGLWLLVKGVSAEKWRVSAAREVTT